MKRFWTDVAVERDSENHGYALTLDGKPVRTPGRAALILPTRKLAEAVAQEWRDVGENLDPAAMPLTGLANAAIDRVAPAHDDFAADLAAYAANDLLCYRAETPAALVARQAELWDPLIDWATTRYDVIFETTAGIMHVDQSPETLHILGDAVSRLDAFDLAGLSPVVRTTGSLIVALAVHDGAVRPDTAWTAGQCDEDWQVSQWGEDELAAQARANRRAEFDAGVTFMACVRH